jgi:hypothetical protein
LSHHKQSKSIKAVHTQAHAGIKQEVIGALISPASAAGLKSAGGAMQAGERSLKIINSRRTHESKTSLYGPDDIKGIHPSRPRLGRQQVHQQQHRHPLELLSVGVGNAGCNVIGLLLVLCLGAAIAIVVGWLFVQILLWMEE